MTLIPYTARDLDELALRLLDFAATFREMSRRSREHGVSDFQLHGNKLSEWLLKVEEWSHDARGKLDTQIIRQRGIKKAKSKGEGMSGK